MPAGEWTAYRGDQRRTARATLPGRIRQPHTLWRWPVGGVVGTTRVVDVDGDGRNEIVASFAGGVTAFRATGERLWSRTFPRGGWLFAVADVDCDGRVEVLAGSANPGQLIVLDARDGAVLSEWTFDDFVGFGGKLHDVDRDGCPELVMFANKVYRNRGENGCVLSFAGGAERPRMLWGSEPTGHVYNLHCRPYPVIGDVDGDGSDEIVFITKWPGASKYAERMIVVCLDAATGRLKDTCDYDGHRPYGALQLADLEGSGRLSVLNAGWGHLATFVWTGRGLNLAYNRSVAEGRTLQDIVGPYGAKGEPMMLVEGQGGTQYGFDHTRSIFDVPSVATPYPYVLLVDPRQSKTVWFQAGHKLAGAADVNGDGAREIYTLDGDVVHAYRHGAETGRLSGARLLYYQPEDPPGVNNNYFPTKSGAQVVHVDADGDGVDELLAVWHATPEAAGRLVWLDGLTLQAKRAAPIGDPAIQAIGVADVFGLGRPQVLLTDCLGRLTVLDPRGDALSSMETGGWQPQPSVARFKPGGKPLVLVANAARQVQCLDVTGNQPEMLWQTGGMLGAGSVPTANLPVSIVDDGPLVESLAQDSARYLFHVACDRKLHLIDAEGRVARSFDPGQSSGERLRVAVGHFLDPQRQDIYVSVDDPAAPIQRDHLIRSDTGETVWTNPVGICWYPAVADVRGAGYDDVLGVWYFTYHHIDGATGQTLFSDGDRPGYHHLAVLDVDGDGKPEALASGGYMSIYCADAATGAVIWKIDDLNYNAGRTAGVADVDGDGVMELGIAFLDGRFNCYSGATGALKWSLDLKAAGSDCIVADVDGDGRMEFVLGCHDEHVWAIGVRDGRPQVLWRHHLQGAVGSPVAADIDGDGYCEILVAAGDGYVYAIG